MNTVNYSVGVQLIINPTLLQHIILSMNDLKYVTAQDSVGRSEML